MALNLSLTTETARIEQVRSEAHDDVLDNISQVQMQVTKVDKDVKKAFKEMKEAAKRRERAEEEAKFNRESSKSSKKKSNTIDSSALLELQNKVDEMRSEDKQKNKEY